MRAGGQVEIRGRDAPRHTGRQIRIGITM
jgi:hypothetical protein